MKKWISLILALAMMLALAACGGKSGAANNGEPNMDTDQTEFTIIGAQSALSPGYEDNEVLNKLQEETGIKITWNTMSDSLRAGEHPHRRRRAARRLHGLRLLQLRADQLRR